MESNTDPRVGYPCALADAPPSGEQIHSVMSSENASIPHSLVSTPSEAQDGRGINRASGVPELTPQMLGRSFLGRSRARVIDTPTSRLLRQGDGVPNMSVPFETSESQIEAPSRTCHEDINRVVDETLLEMVIPANGPMSGAIPIAILGKNFPNNIPLYVRFGSNLADAVGQAQY